MEAWQYTSKTGGIEKHLTLSKVARPTITSTEILVQVHSAALNPADYKVTDSPVPLRLFGTAFIPGMDYCGCVAEVGKDVSGYEVGEWVFGAKTGNVACGTLAQYVAVDATRIAKLPAGVAKDDAAMVGIVGLTGLQALRSRVKEGDRVFINGGSGGTGVFAVQIAKVLGCHVTTSCSATNVALCREMGADEVLDYGEVDVVRELSRRGQVLDLIVDNVGTPTNLYKASGQYLKTAGGFVQVGMSPSLGAMVQVGSNMLLPSVLGGGKAKYQMIIAQAAAEDLAQLGQWLKEGKIKGVADSVFEWKDVPKAFEQQKKGRAKGKVVVHVEQNPA